MAITNFIPEIWSANLLVELRKLLVYGQPGTINRNYEGEIAQAGDTVHITHFQRPAIRSYTRNGNISWDILTDDDRALIVDQQQYFAFSVDDVDRRQALPGFVGEVTGGAAYNLQAVVDTYLSGLMVNGVANGGSVVGIDDASNRLGAKTVALVAGTPAGSITAWDLMVAFRAQLNKASVPQDGRFVIVPTDFYSYMLKDERFVFAEHAADNGMALRNGQIGRAAGFDILESQTVPFAASAYTIVAGHSMATTYAEQITETEALRLQTTFGDGIRGLHVYGGKVTVPNALTSAVVTLA